MGEKRKADRVWWGDMLRKGLLGKPTRRLKHTLKVYLQEIKSGSGLDKFSSG
jgi:hypothetical protein